MDEINKLKIKENEIGQQDNEKEQGITIEPYSTNCPICGGNIITYVNKEYNLTIFLYLIVFLYFYCLFYGSISFGINFFKMLLILALIVDEKMRINLFIQ